MCALQLYYYCVVLRQRRSCQMPRRQELIEINVQHIEKKEKVAFANQPTAARKFGEKTDRCNGRLRHSWLFHLNEAVSFLAGKK